LGCKKDSIEQPPEFGYDYFPIDVGHYNVYQVDSVIYNIPFDTVYRYSFQVKELNEGVYTDSEEKQSVRLVRYYRKSPTDAWVIKNVWSARLKDGKAERQEENIRLLKMVFPLRKNTQWDVNALNTLDKQLAKVDSIDVPYTLNGMAFDKAAFINIITDTNLITYKLHREVYSRKIGLIYSKYYNLQSNTIDVNKPSVLQRIETGVICIKTLIETGKQP
jgi:hypothetical protein